MGDLVTALQELVGAANVATGEAISEDLTHDEALTATPVVPAAVVRPASTAEVAAVVALARDQGVPVTARGSGTGMSGACIPQADGILIAFDRMASLGSIEAQESAAEFVSTQPGEGLGITADEAQSLLRLLCVVAGGAAVAAAMLGFRVLKRERSARLALSVVAPVLVLTGLSTASFLSALVGVAVLPFLAVCIAVLLLVTYVDQIALLLPNALK